jgi:cytochrome c553
MPAWAAANRDDEIWAMVAFLRELPMIDAGKYQHLAFGEQGEGGSGTVEDLNLPERTTRILTESCSRCHGRDGLGRGLGESPKLAGQKPAYLLGSLQAYAAGRRSSGIMGPLAHALGEEQMKQLADHYSSLPTTREIPINLDEKAIERGRMIATSGIPAQRVPACVECHGPSTAPRNEMYPRLESQYAEYLVLQLELFKGKQRGGTAYSHLMHFVAGGLTPEQMSDVAQYFASLDPAPADERAAR